MDAIDRLAMNARLHHLGGTARIREPVQKLAVLTCMDARIDVFKLLGLQPGDAHVVRTGGGRATADAIRSLALSQAAMGTRELMVIHHTDCAIGRVKQEELAQMISEATGHPYTQDLDCFDDPIEAIAEDVGRLRSDPSLAHRDRIRGFLYDLSSNTLSEPE
jgi:carbonic anhydrase